MKLINSPNRCKNCKKVLRSYGKTGYCSACYTDKWSRAKGKALAFLRLKYQKEYNALLYETKVKLIKKHKKEYKKFVEEYLK